MMDSEERPVSSGQAPGDGETASRQALSREAWLREFDAWIASHKPGNPNFDDSRESIYPERC